MAYSNKYLTAVIHSGYKSLNTFHCSVCRIEGKKGQTEAWFGADPQDGHIMCDGPKDRAFKLRIWQAFRKHFREVHPDRIPMVNKRIKRLGLKI